MYIYVLKSNPNAFGTKAPSLLSEDTSFALSSPLLSSETSPSPSLSTREISTFALLSQCPISLPLRTSYNVIVIMFRG